MAYSKCISALIKRFVLAFALGACSIGTNAATIVADPSAFGVGTNVTDAYSGFRFTAQKFFSGEGIQGQPVYNGFVNSEIGRYVFRRPEEPRWGGGVGDWVLRIELDDPATSVSVDFIGYNAGDDVILQAFAPSGAFIGEVSAIDLPIGQSQTLTFTASAGMQIGAVLASAEIPNGQTLIGTVSANTVPIPAAVWLFGSALGLLGWMRRKQ